MEYGNVPHHGKEFHTICAMYHWPKEVAHATAILEKKKNKEKMQSKVQKLLSLSQSTNRSESLAALAKAQQLINQYALSEPRKNEEEWIVRRALHSQRLDQKLKTIAIILRQFHVIPTFHSYSGGVYLELFGTTACVHAGEQIAQHLAIELEYLWNNQYTLKGARQKKSFFIGLAEGFISTLEQKERSLLAYDAALAKAYRTFITKGHILKDTYKEDTVSKRIGQKEGKHLYIPKAASPSFIPGIQWQRAPIYNIPPDL